MPIAGFARDGLTFDVTDSGPSEGEPVVLLHGFPQDGASWRLVAPSLHDAGLRTLVPDQRGYSPGSRALSRRAYVTTELVGDVLALLDAAGLESAHVVGHDFGGGVAWLLAGLAPERVRSLTVLSTPHPRAMAQAITSSRQGLRSWYMLAFQVPWVPELVLRRTLGTFLSRSGLPADFAEHDAARMSQPGALHGPVNWYRGLALGRRSPQPRIDVPTTYVWGRQDPFLGRVAAEATSTFVTAPYRFVELEAGHWLPETHAAAVADEVVGRVRGSTG